MSFVLITLHTLTILDYDKLAAIHAFDMPEPSGVPLLS